MANKCENCRHFVAWPQHSYRAHYEPEPEGVCSAPRPLLGPAPQREVRKRHGENCPMWSKMETPNDPTA
jgi:hypothetical protein